MIILFIQFLSHARHSVIYFTCSIPKPHTLRSGYDYDPKFTDEEPEARVMCSRSHSYKKVANPGCKPGLSWLTRLCSFSHGRCSQWYCTELMVTFFVNLSPSSTTITKENVCFSCISSICLLNWVEQLKARKHISYFFKYIPSLCSAHKVIIKC